MVDDDSWAAIGKSALDGDGPKCDDDEVDVDICAVAERLVFFFFFFQRVYIMSGIQEMKSVRQIQTC